MSNTPLTDEVVAKREAMGLAPWSDLEQLARSLEARLRAMLPLFEEARDALPAISLAYAKLRGIRLDLADRMDEVGSPEKWANHPANPERGWIARGRAEIRASGAHERLLEELAGNGGKAGDAGEP